LSPDQRAAIVRELLIEISSATLDCPTDAEEEDGINHFTWGSSQVNTDLALAADCEYAGDLYVEDPNFYDLMQSPMYLNLVKTFVEDAEGGDSCALLKVIWRAYNAGRVSPERFIPDTKQVRIERSRKEREQKERDRRATQ
jgi:hypothetical protein